MDPVNVLLVVPHEVGSTDRYEEVLQRRFPTEIAGGAIRIRKSVRNSCRPNLKMLVIRA